MFNLYCSIFLFAFIISPIYFCSAGFQEIKINFLHNLLPEDCLVYYRLSLIPNDQSSSSSFSSVTFNTQFPKLIILKPSHYFIGHFSKMKSQYTSTDFRDLNRLFTSAKWTSSSCRISFQFLWLSDKVSSPFFYWKPKVTPVQDFNLQLVSDPFQVLQSPQYTFVQIALKDSLELNISRLKDIPFLFTYTKYIFITREDDQNISKAKLVYLNYLDGFALQNIPVDKPIHDYFEGDFLKERNNMDLNGALVCTHKSEDMFRSYRLFKEECNKFGLSFSGTEDFCAIKMLRYALNLSLITLEDFKKSNKQLVGVVLLTKAKFMVLLEPKFGTGFDLDHLEMEQILTSGTNLPFGFVTVMPKSRSFFSNPLRVFDRFTLLCVICGWLIVSVTFIIFNLPSKSKRNNNNVHFTLAIVKSIFLATLGPLIDQSPSAYIYFFNWTTTRHRHPRNTKLHAMRFIHVLWIVSCIVISGGYKGSFYAFLTKTPPPKAPRTFNQLLKSNLTLITIDTDNGLKSSSSISLFFGVVKDFVDGLYSSHPEFLSASNSSNISISLKRMKKLHVRYMDIFIRATHIRHIPPGDVAVAYAEELPLTSESFFKINQATMEISNSSFTFPSKFSALSSSEGVAYFSRLLRMATGGDISLVKSREWDYYIGTYDEILTIRNLLKPLMTKVYLALKESGIYALWKRYSDRFQVKLDALMIKCLKSQEYVSIITEGERKKCLQEVKASWTNQSYRNAFFRKKPTGGTMSISVALNLIVQLIMGLALACGIFLVEILHRCSEVRGFES